MKPYIPQPIDTNHITLSKDLEKLKERLAQNVHDVWAAQRLKEGWKYGSTRDDNKKEHPCLVPYDELPEAEKEYDRKTMLETLKCITALGFRIESPERYTVKEDTCLKNIHNLLRQSSPALLEQLLGHWQHRNYNLKPFSPQVHRLFADRLIKRGENILAYDVIQDGLRFWPRDVFLRQKKALVFARSGSTSKAEALLLELEKEGKVNQETLGLLGRINKDYWEGESTPSGKKTKYLQRAFTYYHQAYKGRDGGYWSGMNVAVLALIKGDKQTARNTAVKVYEECTAVLKKQPREYLHWVLATMGQACLIMENWDEALELLRQAVLAGRGEYGELISTARSIRLISEHMTVPSEILLQINMRYQAPCVAVFAGHMVDQPGRPGTRFPQQIIPDVKKALKRQMKKLNTLIGFASAACGSDLIFHEALGELKGELYVVLPYDRDEFVNDSVALADSAFWKKKFERMVRRAKEIITVSHQKMEFGSASYEYANYVLNGLACLKARSLNTQLVPIAVWDGRAGDGPGGTESMVRSWRKQYPEVVIIDPLEIAAQKKIRIKTADAQIKKTASGGKILNGFAKPEINALFFADVTKFSTLTDRQIPSFVHHFLGTVARLLEKGGYKPALKNTWGDGLYIVFKSIEKAGLFALDLCEVVEQTDWAGKGLNENTNIRIALHVGPVYPCIDPVTAVRSFTGAHVSRAARIEPITPPGNAYASLQFAAMAGYHNISSFTCDYVGRVPLAKGYGTFPLYHVRRA
jgi:class 3 adenylate cyclase